MSWRIWCAWGLAACAAGPAREGDTDPATEDDDEGEGPVDPEDDPLDAPDPVGPAAPETCSAIEVEAAPAVAPADIVWVIDNSGSMDEEEARVQSNINAFSADIAASGVDHRVVMITDAGHVMVPPPLGGSDRLRIVDRDVDSHDALELVVETYASWRDFLRPESVKHFVVVSDDESDWSSGDFEQAISSLDDPGFPDGFVFHAVVAESPPWDLGSPCFLLAAAIGATYIDLQESHGGVFYSLCESDWDPLFDALSEAVAAEASLPCRFEIPDPRGGDDIDFGAVNFVYTPEGEDGTTIPFVAGADGCEGAGWYYDDPDAPRQIVTCPATCAVLQDGDGRVDVAFGCATLLE